MGTLCDFSCQALTWLPYAGASHCRSKLLNGEKSILLHVRCVACVLCRGVHPIKDTRSQAQNGSSINTSMRGSLLAPSMQGSLLPPTMSNNSHGGASVMAYTVRAHQTCQPGTLRKTKAFGKYANNSFCRNCLVQH